MLEHCLVHLCHLYGSVLQWQPAQRGSSGVGLAEVSRAPKGLGRRNLTDILILVDVQSHPTVTKSSHVREVMSRST